MTAKAIHIITYIIISLLCFTTQTHAQKTSQNDYFYILTTKQGLSDNCIYQMIQLPDGKMVIETSKGINIYDGKRFQFVPLSLSDAQKISKYKGHVHLYTDNKDRLWIKDYQRVFCIDLKKLELIKKPLEQLNNPISNTIQDVFVDSNKEVWYIIGDQLFNNQTGKSVTLNKAWGNVQDIDTEKGELYTFHETGTVAVFNMSKSALCYTAKAYDASNTEKYNKTSLTIKSPNGQFYQIRTGRNQESQKDYSIFLHFNPQNKRYETIYTCNDLLHTLNMPSNNQALISSRNGYLMFDFKIGKTPREVRKLTLPDGKSLTTGINTVYKDQDGGIWLGTYNDGLIYVSPMLGLFFTIDNPWYQSSWTICIFIAILLIALFCVYFLLLRKGKKQNKQLTVTKDIKVTEEEKEPAFITKARELVIAHLQDSEYGVEELAKDLYMERSGFYKKLTSLMSITPVSFIKKIRLQQASIMLKEKKWSVNEIAERTGFSSASYFSKCFKKEYGVLPSEYC